MVKSTHNKRNANENSTEYYFSLISLAKIQKFNSKLVYKVVRNVHSNILPMGIQNGTNLMVGNSTISNKSKSVSTL